MRNKFTVTSLVSKQQCTLYIHIKRIIQGMCGGDDDDDDDDDIDAGITAVPVRNLTRQTAMQTTL